MKKFIVTVLSIFLISSSTWAEVAGVSVEDGNIYGKTYKTDSGNSLKDISEVDTGALGAAVVTGNDKALNALGKIDKKILECDNEKNPSTKCNSSKVSAAVSKAKSVKEQK